MEELNQTHEKLKTQIDDYIKANPQLDKAILEAGKNAPTMEEAEQARANLPL